MRKILVAIAAVFIITLALNGFSENAQAANETYNVKKGDSLWLVSQKFGVPVAAIKKVNNKKSDQVYVGESLQIPYIVKESEKDLLARLIRAEAEGESYAGKVAVGTVVLNRVDSPLFPNTLKEVIYEISPGGYYAFEPVKNGEINKPADADSKKAVEEALEFRGQGRGSLFYYNPDKTDNQWMRTRQVTTKIGNHLFAK